VAAEAAVRDARQLAPKAAGLSTEALEEALRIIESEPLKAIELAAHVLRSLNHTFEVSSLESALRAHRARLQLESGGGVEASG
jgi:hypothetical protein